jgi:preprotein translocase subunit SecG
MVFHAVISFFLIGMVLIQFGKGAEAGLFSGTSDSVFTGAQQGNILGKITMVLAVLFLANSIFLAKLQSKKADDSILAKESKPISRPLNSDNSTPVATPSATPTSK